MGNEVPDKPKPTVQSPDYSDISSIFSNEFLEQSRRQLEQQRNPYLPQPTKPSDKPASPQQPSDKPTTDKPTALPTETPEQARNRRAQDIINGVNAKRPADRLFDDITKAFKAEPTENAQRDLADYLNRRMPEGVYFESHRANGAQRNMEVTVYGISRSPMVLPLGKPTSEINNGKPPAIAGTDTQQYPGFTPGPSDLSRTPLYPSLPGYRPEVPQYPSTTNPFQPQPGTTFQPAKPTGVYDTPPLRPAAPAVPADAGDARATRVQGIVTSIGQKGEAAVDDIKKAFQAEGTEANQRALAAALSGRVAGVEFSPNRAPGNASNMEVTVTGLSRRGQPFVIPLGHPRLEPYR